MIYRVTRTTKCYNICKKVKKKTNHTTREHVFDDPRDNERRRRQRSNKNLKKREKRNTIG